MTRLSECQQQKRSCQTVDFAVPVDHGVKIKESEKRDKNLNHASELCDTTEHEGDRDTNSNLCTQNNSQSIGKATERFGNQMTSRDHPECSII